MKAVPTCNYYRGVVDANPPPPAMRFMTYCECEKPYLPGENDIPPAHGGDAWRAVQGRKKSQPVQTSSADTSTPTVKRVPYPAPTPIAERCPACLRAKTPENLDAGIDEKLCVCVPIPRAERDRLTAVEAQARRLVEAFDCLRGLTGEK